MGILLLYFQLEEKTLRVEDPWRLILRVEDPWRQMLRVVTLGGKRSGWKSLGASIER